MDKIETLTTELNQKKQSLLEDLQKYIYPDTNIPQIAKCLKSLHQISVSLLKINLFKDTHEDLQLHNIDEYKEKSLEEILYSAIEEPFPKTLKIMTTLKYLLPGYYKDMLLRALESNEFKEITYLLPPGNLQNNPKGNSQSVLRQELWSTLNNSSLPKDPSQFLYVEDIAEYLSSIGERENIQPIKAILQEDSTIEVLEKKEWEKFIQEMTDLNRAEFFIRLAESLYNESGDLKTSLKVLEDAFFRGYSLEVLRDKLIFYSISCLMIYKIGIITMNLKDLETLKGATLIDHLFETVLQYKPKQLLLLKQNLKSIYSLYSTEETLSQLFEEFLLSQTVRTFGIFLTLDQKSPDNIKQLLIEDENKLYDLVYKFIHQNCFFEHYEFINKMVKLLKSTLTLETRLKFIEDIEKLEFDAECVELLFNFNVNQKFSSLEEFEEMDKLAQSRERGLDILSQIVTNYNRNYIRFAHVTLKGKPIDLKSARAVLNVLLHLQEHVMKKCINVSLVYQVFVKKLLEFGNTRDVQQLIDRENLLGTIDKEIFEMIVVEVVSKMLDKLPNLSMLDDDLTIKIKRCFDLIPWNSEVKDAERALYKVCLQLKDSEELYSLSPNEIRSCNKIELLKKIVKSSSKAFEKASYVDLYTLLRQIEFKSIDGDKEFIAFMADFVDSYLQNNDKRKVDDLIDYLNENDYEKISEVLIKILKEKSVAVKSKDKEYYMKLGVLKCRDPNLLVEYFKDDSVPFLKDLNKDIYTDSPASMKILLADFDLLTPEVYRKRQEFDTTWNMKAFFIDMYKKITAINRQWNDALFFFLSNLTVNHQRAFAFLAQAPGITISTFDTIFEMLIKSTYFNIEKICAFFLNYVLPDNLKYNIYASEQASNWYKQYGSSADFQRVITKYQDLQALGKDFASFQSLVDWKDQVKFVYDQEFRKDVISKMIVVAHSDPEIVEKAHKYGLEADFIHLRMLESTFYSISETNVTESLNTIKETLEQISFDQNEQKNFIQILRDNIYEKSPSIKYLPELFSLISEKIPNCFNPTNLKLLQALISVNLQDKLKPFISFKVFLAPEFQNSSFDKILDFGKLKEVVKKEIDQSNVFILSKCIPVLIPNSLTPEDIQFTMLLNQICENNILWQKMNLIRISEGRISENNEAKLYIDRIDMLLNQMSPKLLLAVLKELVYINMDISGVSQKEDSNLPQFLKLSLHYQQFFIEKILKKLTEKGYLVHPQEEEIGLSQVVKVKLRLLNQLEGLYQNDLPKVLPLRDFMGIKSPNRLSNFIFGLFNHEVISSPMLVGLIKELGKDAFIKGYLKKELSVKLEETSIEISDRLWDVWDQAITFKKILSTNRLEKNNFVVNLEKIENDNSQEFEPLIRFLQKTNELFILDEEFAQETRDSLAEVIISTVIENPNYQFRLKLMLLYISFKYMSEISVSTQQRNKNAVFEIFALLDKGFNEYESMFQFGKFLLDVLLSDSPGIFLVQLFDNLVFAPKEKLFYQNLILRDVATRLPSDDLIRHCLDNLINFNCHESSDMIFDLFFVRRTKAITVDRETSTKNILNLVLEEMSYKVDRKTKFKIEENIQNLIKPILPGSKGAQLIYKYLIYKARTSILQKTDHYEPCLEFAKDMFRAFSNKQEISEDFDIEEVIDYNEDIHQICIYELWAGKTLEYIVLKNVIDLIDCGSDLEAARIVTEYLKEVKLEEGPAADDKASKNLKSFLEGVMRDEKGVYKKIQPLVKATYDKIN